MSTAASPAIVRLGIAEIELRIHVNRSTIFRWYKASPPRFPAPEYLDDRRTWRLEVVEAWEREQLARPPEARRGAANLHRPEPTP